MLKRELKILKYIKRNQPVSEPNLKRKFADFDLCYAYISNLIDIRDVSEEELERRRDEYFKKNEGKPQNKFKGEFPEPENNPKNVFYTLSHEGESFFEGRLSKRLSFILPYGITTFIALISATPTIYKIFKFTCNLFVQGTP